MSKELGFHITFKSLLRFTTPGIFLMMFLALYIMVDGIFISNYLGTDGLSALNITYPVISIILATGIMLGTGGSVLCAINMGRGKLNEARQDFTFINLMGFLIGVVISVVIIVFLKPIIYWLGSTDLIYQECEDYLIYSLYFAPFFILQYVYQYLLITAGRPKLAFISTFIGGMTNIILDYVFIGVLGMGMMGAAIATGLGGLFAALFGFLCFILSRKIVLNFARPTQRFKSFTKRRIKQFVSVCSNGSAEMAITLSGGVVTFLFNIVALKLAGEVGIASIASILYAQYLLNAIYFGYAGTTGPVISFNHGAKRNEEVKKIFNYSLVFIIIASIAVFSFSYLFAKTISLIFFENGSNVYLLTITGIKFFAITFLFSGMNIFALVLFRAFANGKLSVFISLLRCLIFITLFLMVLPEYMGIYGMWLAIPFAEISTFIISIYLLKKYKKVYNY